MQTQTGIYHKNVGDMTAKIINNSKQTGVSGQKTPLLLDTLAQLRTAGNYQAVTDPSKSRLKRAVAKYKTNKLIYKLIDLDSTLHDYYWNTWHCNNVLLQKKDTITGHYCNGRACIVCGRIRTAKLIKGYLPVIKTFREPMFFTPTIPSVKGEHLEGAIVGMNKVHRKIVDNLRKTKGLVIKGLRKLEVNPEKETVNHSYRDTFSPHNHFILDGRKEAEAYRDEWLKHYPEAYEGAQDIRPADESSLIELFKYTTKLAAPKAGDAEKLDVIFRALYNKRCVQPVGIKKYVSEDVEGIQSEEIEGLQHAIDVWVWKQEKSDWFNTAGIPLTGCEEYRKDKAEADLIPTPEEMRAKRATCRDNDEVSRPLDLGELRDKAIEAFEAEVWTDPRPVIAHNLATGAPIY